MIGFVNITAQKMKFSIKDFFSKCDQIRRKLRIWSRLQKKSLMENFIFCAVYAQGSEYTKVLNVPLVLNIAEFWMHQGSECVSGSEYARVLNMPGLHRAWICFDRSEWFLNMPNMPEYVWIYLKLTEFLFMCLSPFKSFVYLNA